MQFICVILKIVIKNAVYLCYIKNSNKTGDKMNCKKLKNIIALRMLKEKSLLILFFLFLINVVSFVKTSDIYYEIGMFISFLCILFFIFDYKGY